MDMKANQDPTQIDLGAEQGVTTVVIEKRPDGSFVVESDQREMEAGSMDEALEMARTALGGGEADPMAMRQEVESEVFGGEEGGRGMGMKSGEY